MDIREDTAGGITTVELRGRLDDVSASGVQARLLKLIESGTHRFVLDLSQLTYCNSLGLRVFLTAAKRLTPFGGKIVLCGAPPTIQLLLKAAAFDRIFTICSTREDAALALDSPPSA